jgi:hypothetical protein
MMKNSQTHVAQELQPVGEQLEAPISLTPDSLNTEQLEKVSGGVGIIMGFISILSLLMRR